MEVQLTKTSVAQKVLHGADISSVRIDESSGKGSLIDVIRMVLGCTSGNAATALSRLFLQDDCTPSIESRTTHLRINGGGRLTPVSDLRTLLEVVWMTPGKISANFRRKSAETLCRVLGGDLALVREIRQNDFTWKAIEGGDMRRSLLQPIDFKQVDSRHRVKECSVSDAVAVLVGGEREVETPAGFIDVLSDTAVIEVKHYRQWKHGLGQVLAYHMYYPRLTKRLHLFARTEDVITRKVIDLARSVCGVHAVKVSFEEIPTLSDEVTRK